MISAEKAIAAGQPGNEIKVLLGGRRHLEFGIRRTQSLRVAELYGLQKFRCSEFVQFYSAIDETQPVRNAAAEIEPVRLKTVIEHFHPDRLGVRPVGRHSDSRGLSQQEEASQRND